MKNFVASKCDTTLQLSEHPYLGTFMSLSTGISISFSWKVERHLCGTYEVGVVHFVCDHGISKTKWKDRIG